MTNINSVSSIGRIESRPAPSPRAIALALLLTVGVAAELTAAPPRPADRPRQICLTSAERLSDDSFAIASADCADLRHPVVATDIAISPDGRYAVSDSDGAPTFYDLQTGARTGRPTPTTTTLRGHDSWVFSVAFSPDGAHALSGSFDTTLKYWNLQTGTLISTLRGHDDSVFSVAFSPDGSHALSGGVDRTLKYWNLQTGSLISTLRGHDSWVFSVAFSPDGSHALSGGCDERDSDGYCISGTLKYWNLQTGSLISTLRGHDGSVKSVAFSPDGSHALSGSNDNTLKYWNLQTGSLISTLRGHENWVWSVAISPDGAHALSGGCDERDSDGYCISGTLKYWNLQTGSLISTLRGHEGLVFSVAISPDGSHALSGSQDNTLKYWNLQTGGLISTLLGHDYQVLSVAISPDGAHALSGSADNTLKYWNLQTGSLISTLRGHDSFVWSVAFSPDGSHALSGSQDDTLKFWNLQNLDPTSWTTHATALLSTQGRAPSGGDALALLSQRVGELRREALHVPLVPEPPLPPLETIEQDPFENRQQFRERIAQVRQNREAQIASITARYRRQVEARNRELERRQSQSYTTGIIAAAFTNILGAPTITPILEGGKPKYDPEAERLFVSLSWSASDYHEKPAFSGEIAIDGLPAGRGGKASQAFTGLQDGSLGYRLAYRIGEGNAISLDGVILDWPDGEARYAARPDDGSGVQIAAPQRVVFAQQGIDAGVAALQNPNLKDAQLEAYIVTETANFDDDIPALLATAPQAPEDESLWLLAIGIQEYGKTANINFSRRSAELFVEVAQKRLGIPEGQVVALYDGQATSGAIKDTLLDLQERMTFRQRHNPGQEQRLLFYYSGHGVPVTDDDRRAYLMPSDVSPDHLSRDPYFRASDFYRYLSDELPVSAVVAFMDSCFTGETDGASVFLGKTAATSLAPREITFDKRKMAVLTAGTDEQFSNSYPAKGHRLFSYYLMQELLTGHATVGDLYREVKVAVGATSRDFGGSNRQDPVLEGNGGLRF